MPPPRLRFFNEVDAGALSDVFTTDTLHRLVELRAGVTMGLRDFSSLRAQTIRRLSDAGVPVGAWVLLPREAGYFATHDNVTAVASHIDALREWARVEDLSFEAIGLDFEPALPELERVFTQPVRTLARWAARSSQARTYAAARAFQQLIDRLRQEGLRVETYQLPVLLDDRQAGGAALQRWLGALDVQADREVVMLYTSLLGPAGPGLLESYASQASAVAVGSTGGGIDLQPKLTWLHLERDLRLAARRCSDVSIFSLEGCVAQRWLEPLTRFDWDAPVQTAAWARTAARLGRRFLRLAAQL